MVFDGNDTSNPCVPELVSDPVVMLVPSENSNSPLVTLSKEFGRSNNETWSTVKGRFQVMVA